MSHGWSELITTPTARSPTAVAAEDPITTWSPRLRQTVEFDLPSVERHAEKVASDNGFTDISHTLENFGTCADCAGT